VVTLVEVGDGVATLVLRTLLVVMGRLGGSPEVVVVRGVGVTIVSGVGSGAGAAGLVVAESSGS
jgi:hypothetical protein